MDPRWNPPTRRCRWRYRYKLLAKPNIWVIEKNEYVEGSVFYALSRLTDSVADFYTASQRRFCAFHRLRRNEERYM